MIFPFTSHIKDCHGEMELWLFLLSPLKCAYNLQSVKPSVTLRDMEDYLWKGRTCHTLELQSLLANIVGNWKPTVHSTVEVWDCLGDDISQSVNRSAAPVDILLAIASARSWLVEWREHLHIPSAPSVAFQMLSPPASVSPHPAMSESPAGSAGLHKELNTE